MNEVEKMYENAEPNRNCNLYKHFTECPMKHTQCEDCENFVYPPFTAEKQIELIKWLLQNKRLFIRKAEYSNNFYMDTLSNRLAGVDNKDFELCLASLVNYLWRDLTEEERKQIKEILE